jgi:glycogen debranching enzyme
VFAGFSRTEAGVPIVYPTATKPQAWAAGTTISLLALLLGLEPDPRRHTLVSTAPEPLPSWAGSLRLTGVPAFGETWNVLLEDGRVAVDKS